jgi:hypothetical protein
MATVHRVRHYKNMTPEQRALKVFKVDIRKTWLRCRDKMRWGKDMTPEQRALKVSKVDIRKIWLRCRDKMRWGKDSMEIIRSILKLMRCLHISQTIQYNHMRALNANAFFGSRQGWI